MVQFSSVHYVFRFVVGLLTPLGPDPCVGVPYVLPHFVLPVGSARVKMQLRRPQLIIIITIIITTIITIIITIIIIIG
jgi:hypothetical protein